jgi:hypothetical protein
MSVHDVKWREAAKKAEAYLAVGQAALYIARDGEYPWEFVSRISSGASYRNEIPVSVTFEADHPCGLTFKWFWDLETRGANGGAGYIVDVPNVAATLSRLESSPARGAFVDYLRRAADALQKTADQALVFAQAQYGQERTLRVLIDGGGERIS